MAKKASSKAGSPRKKGAPRKAPAKASEKAVKRPAPKVKAPAPSQAELFAVASARLLADDKCTDVVVLDVRGASHVTDFIVIGSGTSDRQMHSVLRHVEDLAKEAGIGVWRSSRDEGGLWLLLDCVDVVVHLFEPNTRAHYDLEMLWGDSPRLAWERPDQQPRDRAGLASGA